jgi:hypothetical protein
VAVRRRRLEAALRDVILRINAQSEASLFAELWPHVVDFAPTAWDRLEQAIFEEYQQHYAHMPFAETLNGRPVQLVPLARYAIYDSARVNQFEVLNAESQSTTPLPSWDDCFEQPFAFPSQRGAPIDLRTYFVQAYAFNELKKALNPASMLGPYPAAELLVVQQPRSQIEGRPRWEPAQVELFEAAWLRRIVASFRPLYETIAGRETAAYRLWRAVCSANPPLPVVATTEPVSGKPFRAHSRFGPTQASLRSAAKAGCAAVAKVLPPAPAPPPPPPVQAPPPPPPAPKPVPKPAAREKEKEKKRTHPRSRARSAQAAKERMVASAQSPALPPRGCDTCKKDFVPEMATYKWCKDCFQKRVAARSSAPPPPTS